MRFNTFYEPDFDPTERIWKETLSEKRREHEDIEQSLLEQRDLEQLHEAGPEYPDERAEIEMAILSIQEPDAEDEMREVEEAIREQQVDDLSDLLPERIL
ncbi:hypothetical protein AAU61_17045 [Desulfocarbo indianensis]|nr:hypothetical protein AAU61_17045 [Desulfocarbo indianensis]